jgi:glycosyltransferase involved in cell wall biosynthesis
MFVAGGLVRMTITDRLPGSGVDLDRFVPSSLPNQQMLRFLLISRMIWDKGVGEYVEAARILRSRNINADFCLLGFLDVKNPTAISRQQMYEWVNEGVVRYLGASDDVGYEIAAADCVVLPSYYREGVPRTLLEAAAMGRPIITADSIGCREVVDDGINGYLVQPRNAHDLAQKMERLILLSPNARTEMGKRSREKAERVFNEQIVIMKYLEAIDEGLSQR